MDGHDPADILRALEAAASVRGAPSMIIANTVKGKGISFAENTATFHNGILSKEQFEQARAELESQLRAAQG